MGWGEADACDFAPDAGTVAGGVAGAPPGSGNPFPHFGQLHSEPGASGGAFMLPWQCGHVIRGGVLKESCPEAASVDRLLCYSSRGAETSLFNEKSLREAGAPRRLASYDSWL